jgi:hypothetical protein
MAISLGAALDRQWRSRFRSVGYVVATIVPALLISFLLFQTAAATKSPATVVFLSILSALWIGGSSCVREIVDERRLVQREPHLSLFAYGLAKILHAIVLGAGQSVILTLFLHYTDVVFLPFLPLWAMLFLTTVSGALLAMLLSTLCDEAATALAWFPLLLVPQVVFGGFLFPYGDTAPFAADPSAHTVTVMPRPLIRPKVDSPLLTSAGAVIVSRWALETYAAEVFSQDLSDADHLGEAIQVSFFMPLTLTERQISGPLLDYVMAGGTSGPASPPSFDARVGRYRVLLAAFPVAEGLLLLGLLPLRDPRRV